MGRAQRGVSVPNGNRVPGGCLPQYRYPTMWHAYPHALLITRTYLPPSLHRPAYCTHSRTTETPNGPQPQFRSSEGLPYPARPPPPRDLPCTRLLLSDFDILELGDEIRDGDGGVKLVGVGVGSLLLQLRDRPAAFCVTK